MDKINEDKIASLENRIKKLESDKQNKFRVFVQFLLSPILIIIIGGILNNQLEKKKTEIQQIQLAQNMMASLFSDDAHKSFATQKLMEKALEDDSLNQEIGKIVERYYRNRVEELLYQGEIESAKKIVNAAESIGGSVAHRFLEILNKENKSDEKTAAQEHERETTSFSSKFERAFQKEREGFNQLIAGNFDEAIKAFEEAERIYHGFHQVYEIANLLKEKRSELDDKEQRKRVFKQIIKEKSWKAPADLLEKLEKIAYSP